MQNSKSQAGTKAGKSTKADVKKSSQTIAKPNVRRSYFLVLDKTNKVVCDFTEEKDAQSYVAARPYLRYEPFTCAEEDVSDMDWF